LLRRDTSFSLCNESKADCSRAISQQMEERRRDESNKANQIFMTAEKKSAYGNNRKVVGHYSGHKDAEHAGSGPANVGASRACRNKEREKIDHSGPFLHSRVRKLPDESRQAGEVPEGPRTERAPLQFGSGSESSVFIRRDAGRDWPREESVRTSWSSTPVWRSGAQTHAPYS
jgi:hypothetical protein